MKGRCAGSVPPAGQGRVIITSQSQHWPGPTVLDLPVPGTEVAARFLVSRAGDPNEAAAASLAGELGGLRLALERATACAQATGISLAAYLALFRRRRADLPDRGQPAGHATVAATLSLAMSRLGAESPAADGLSRLLACTCAAGARDQYAALLPIRERVSGPDHPGTLTARENLACWIDVADPARTSYR